MTSTSLHATELARNLAAADVSVRDIGGIGDIGAILGVSHQWAHQLVSAR